MKNEEKASIHPIMRLKEKELAKQEAAAEAYTEPSQLDEHELEDLIEKLKLKLNNTNEEIKKYEENSRKIEEKIKEVEENVKNVKNDRDLYRDVFNKEQKLRNENKFLIENQRKIIESIANIPLKSPKRPSSQGLPRGKK